MWFLVLSFIFTQSAAKCTVARVKIAFLVDSSGSVIEVEGNFQRQIKIANSVLSSVRNMFSDVDADDKLEWGVIEFGTQAKVTQKMHVSTGNSDNMDEYMKVQCQGNVHSGENWNLYCATSYARSLDEAISMLGDEEDAKRFIWFLSDGMPGDLIFVDNNNKTDPAKLKKFREEKLDAKEIRTVCSFLAPQNATSVQLATSTMRALCDDDVLADMLGESFDAAAYTEKAEIMFSDAVKTNAFVCEPAVWVTLAFIVAAIIAACCCCCAGVKAKKHFFEEEEGVAMTQAYSRDHGAARGGRSGKRARQGNSER